MTINRPKKRNALSPELVMELRTEVDRVKQDDRVKIVMLTGAGDAFCAGADLAYLQKLSQFSEDENLYWYVFYIIFTLNNNNYKKEVYISKCRFLK